MRREDRLGGKPTNKTRGTGKSKVAGCGLCHNHPVSKSGGKRKDRVKRLAYDKHINPHLFEFFVRPLKSSRAYQEQSYVEDLPAEAIETWDFYDSGERAEDVNPTYGQFTISNVIEAALNNIQRVAERDMEFGYDDVRSVDETPDLEAFRIECENFKAAIEASLQATTMRTLTPSEQSWSDVDVTDTNEEWDDGWSMVDCDF